MTSKAKGWRVGMNIREDVAVKIFLEREEALS